jgi:putative transposase
MYNWRQMTDLQRAEVLRLRQQLGQPWHGPPHGLEAHWYHISAACYEHAPIAGESPERMADFERELLLVLRNECEQVSAWCLLPNHYHALVQAVSLRNVRACLGQLHGHTAFIWNQQEGLRGRTCWHRCLPKSVRSERHRWATLNYIHHNPVHHGYVRCWQDWPFSSAAAFLAAVGRARAEELWRRYPVLDFGAGWDNPDC